jgi:acetyl esterase
VLALYPATDAERSGGSREVSGSGFGLTTEYLAELERLYLPDGVPTDDTRGAVLRADDLSTMPPVYLATAGFDPLRDEGAQYAKALGDAGNRVSYVCFERQIHGFVPMGKVLDEANTAVALCAAELRRALRA